MGEYVGLAKACLAWTHWRAGRFSEAEELCHEARQVWSELSFRYPFEWTAALILLALDLGGEANGQGVLLARELYAEHSARLPDSIDSALGVALAGAEQGDATRVQDGLRNAVAAALDLGYI
jgi:hypothetical protein